MLVGVEERIVQLVLAHKHKRASSVYHANRGLPRNGYAIMHADRLRSAAVLTKIDCCQPSLFIVNDVFLQPQVDLRCI